MYDAQPDQMSTILQCLTPIVFNGCRYNYLAADLPQYFPRLQEMADSKLEFIALTEFINLIYVVCLNVGCKETQEI